MSKKNIIQGVWSEIIFLLGEDEIATGKAINCLLEEGWKFRELTKKSISVHREWEVIEEELKDKDNKPT